MSTENQEEEITPLTNFSDIDKDGFDYEQEVKKYKKFFITRIIENLFLVILGIILLLCIKTPYVGVIYFIAAFFYCFPMGIIKTIFYINRLKHVRDIVAHPDGEKKAIDFFHIMHRHVSENKRSRKEEDETFGL